MKNLTQKLLKRNQKFVGEVAQSKVESLLSYEPTAKLLQPARSPYFGFENSGINDADFEVEDIFVENTDLPVEEVGFKEPLTISSKLQRKGTGKGKGSKTANGPEAQKEMGGQGIEISESIVKEQTGVTTDESEPPKERSNQGQLPDKHGPGYPRDTSLKFSSEGKQEQDETTPAFLQSTGEDGRRPLASSREESELNSMVGNGPFNSTRKLIGVRNSLKFYSDEKEQLHGQQDTKKRDTVRKAVRAKLTPETSRQAGPGNKRTEGATNIKIGAITVEVVEQNAVTASRGGPTKTNKSVRRSSGSKRAATSSHFGLGQL